MIRPFHLYRIYVLEPVAYGILAVCQRLWWLFRGVRYLLGFALAAAAACAFYEQFSEKEVYFLPLRGNLGDKDFYSTFVMYNVYAALALIAGLRILYRRQEE